MLHIRSAFVLAGMVVAALAGPAHAQQAPATPGLSFPMVRNAAVIPFQWQGVKPESYRWQEIYQQLDGDFFRAVKASERFHLINPGVSDDLWSSPSGRRTLAERYELQGYLNLTATEKNGSVKLVARLLSPTLSNIFLESSTYGTRTLLALTPEQLRERITDLAYRLINRFPLDARITSVQGQFVTLSAGRNLGIGSKESYPVYRVTVATVHPATGGPETFSRKNLGWVEIIDSRQFTSIARIVRQNTEGAIATMDGIFIPTMTTRARFPEQNARPQATKPVIPLPSEPVQPATPVPAPPPAPTAPPPAKQPLAPVVQQAPRALQPIDIGLGIYSFSVNGRPKTSSNFPSMLLNSLRLGTRMATDAATQWEVEGGYASGDTTRGAFNLIEVMAQGTVHQSEPSSMQFFPNRYWGVFVRYASKGVTGRELFGGFDLLSVGGAAGLYSNYRQLSPDLIGRFSIDLKLSPLGFGQMGLAGNKQQVGQYLGALGSAKLLMQPKGESGLWFGPRVDVNWQKLGAKGTDIEVLSTLVSGMATLAF